MKCGYCQSEFSPNSSGQKYCDPACRSAAARRIKLQLERETPHLLRRRAKTDEEKYKAALEKFVKAKEDLAALRATVEPSIVGKLDTAHVLEVAMQDFNEKAQANADDVTQARVLQFLDYLGWDHLFRQLSRFMVEQGYTDYDIECIITKLRGEPRPIVIDSDRAVSPYNIMGFEIGEDPDLD